MRVLSLGLRVRGLSVGLTWVLGSRWRVGFWNSSFLSRVSGRFRSLQSGELLSKGSLKQELGTVEA